MSAIKASRQRGTMSGASGTVGAKLAIDGGEKAFGGMTGKAEPKIGTEEFLAMAKRFGYNEQAMARIRAAVSDADLIPPGPNLARYACPFPPDPAGPKFEQAARDMFGVKFALGVSSGTAALHAAAVAAGVGPGTEVIVPAVGFMATGIAVVISGGVPVFCDVDHSLHMDASKLEALITPRTVAVAPTHHWGGVCDLDPVITIARKHKLKVIEDCAQSPGAKYKGRYVGSIGDLGCFSISAYKIIGGGEGGLVTANDQRLFDRVCQLAECGGLWRPDRFAPPRYDGELFAGTNYRLSDLEATVDVVQMAKLDGIVSRHRHVRHRITSQLKGYKDIEPQRVNDVEGHIGYLLRFYPRTTELGDKIVAALRAEGVECGTRGSRNRPDWHLYSHMFPIILKTAAAAQASPFTDPRYLQKGGQARYEPGACPVADDLFNRCISMQLNQWWNDADCDAIAAAINKVLGAYCEPDANAPAWH